MTQHSEFVDDRTFDVDQKLPPALQSNAAMQTPNVFLAYAPRAGLRCALAYLASERDAYGWFTGPRHDASIASCFFLLEDFYANRMTRYEAVEQGELHSGWLLDEARRQDLARMQEAFAGEWLVYRDDARAAAELQAYAEAELAAGEVNVRFKRLAKLSRLHPVWTYYSPRFERPVLKYLATHWPLEYRLHEEAAAVPRRRTARSCP
jgi:hypothetical protein